MTARIAILGASGYTGREVLRLVRNHPAMQADVVCSARAGVEPAPPTLSYDPVVTALDLDQLVYVDGAFVCAPHGAAAELVVAARDVNPKLKIVDLSADFRLRDAATYAATYGKEHPAPDLLEHAVYGLTEVERDRVAAATLVANPGCYPTCVLLALGPLLRAGLVAPGSTIIADCKSGASGAGKTPQPRTVYGSVHDNVLAYGVGTHRHTPEIWQEAGTESVVFVPHLLPLFRGMLATIYVEPAPGTTRADALSCLDDAWGGEPCVRVYDRGLPEVDRVAGTNFCDVAVAEAYGRLVLVSAIDNLVKGAAGQALQNMNLMLGLDETTGLPL